MQMEQRAQPMASAIMEDVSVISALLVKHVLLILVALRTVAGKVFASGAGASAKQVTVVQVVIQPN